MDGISINERIYVFGLRLKKSNGGVFDFEIVGVSLIDVTFCFDGKEFSWNVAKGNG